MLFKEDGLAQTKGKAVQDLNIIINTTLALVGNKKTNGQTRSLKTLKTAHGVRYRKMMLKV